MAAISELSLLKGMAAISELSLLKGMTSLTHLIHGVSENNITIRHSPRLTPLLTSFDKTDRTTY
jgi:hypothetical protein